MPSASSRSSRWTTASIALHSSRAASKLCNRSCHGPSGVLSATFRMNAQCHLSNEVDSFGCAAQYDRRARADAQLRIDWKVTHSQLTPSCGSSSIHHTTFVFRCRAILLLDAEGCLIEERRVAVKASLNPGLNAAP